MFKKILVLGLIFCSLHSAVEVEVPHDIMTPGIQTLDPLALTSPQFHNNGPIPWENSKEGENRSPQLEWTGVANIAKEFALTCDDPDAKGFVHWVVYNIPGSSRSISTQLKRAGQISDGTKQGVNSFGNIGYDGPMPPKGDKPHQYFFTLYVLDKPITLKQGATKQELLQAMHRQSTIVQTIQLIGTYQRKTLNF